MIEVLNSAGRIRIPVTTGCGPDDLLFNPPARPLVSRPLSRSERCTLMTAPGQNDGAAKHNGIKASVHAQLPPELTAWRQVTKYGRRKFYDLACSRQSATKSEVLASPAHITVSAPPQ